MDSYNEENLPGLVLSSSLPGWENTLDPLAIPPELKVVGSSSDTLEYSLETLSTIEQSVTPIESVEYAFLMGSDPTEPSEENNGSLAYDLNDWGSTDVTLSWSGEETDSLLQFHDRQGTLLASQSLVGINRVTIAGTEADDSLRIAPWTAPLSIELIFEGRGGIDTLLGATNDSQWFVTAADQGYLTTSEETRVINFAVENLVGAANNQDTFIIEDEGSLSGLIAGGDGGFDTLVTNGDFHQTQFIATGPDSGFVLLGDHSISYQGLEPVTDNSMAPNKLFNATGGDDQINIDSDVVDDTIIIDSLNGTFEDHTLREPNQLLTINAGDGDDTIAFDALFYDNKFLIDGGVGNDTIDVSGRPVAMSVVKYSDGSAALFDLDNQILLRGFENFVGVEGTIVETGIPAWLEQGPATITNGQVMIPPNNPVSGAINSVAPHPFDANTMFIASVNGGIWRTTDGGNNWAALTDQFPSLSIGDLAISPLDADGMEVTNMTPLNQLVIYAGTGKFSSFRNAGGFNVGLYKSSDGGATWSVIAPTNVIGLDITAVVPTRNTDVDQQVVLLSALSKRDGGGVVRQGGIFRSTDGGRSFERIVDGEATDLVADPGNANRFYAGVQGQGVMISTDGGATWNPVPGGGPALNMDTVDNDMDGTVDNAGETAATAGRILLAVQQSNGANNAVFAAIIGNDPNDRLMGVFHSTDAGMIWNAIGAAPPDTNTDPGPQGDKHFSIAADSTGNNVYVGGDVRANPPFVGNLFIGNVTTGNWSSIILGGANNTAPHADSRDLAFDANGNLLETDDGGIYRLSNPATAGRTWTSLNGDLRLTETLSVAYDPVNNIIFSGNQDNGSTEQTLARMMGNPNLAFLDAGGVNPDTITRTGGNWINDGFRVGQTIRISNAGANNGTYTISTVTATVLTLQPGESLTTAATPGASVVQIMPDPIDVDRDYLPEDNDTRSPWRIISTPFPGAFGPNNFVGDGNSQLAIPINTDGDPEPEQTLRFTMGNNFSSFTARLFDANGQDITPPATMMGGNFFNSLGNPLLDNQNPPSGFVREISAVGLRSGAGQRILSGLDVIDQGMVTNGDFNFIPYAVNAVNSNKMAIGHFALYDSTDRLETIRNLIPSTLGSPRYGIGDYYTAIGSGII